MKQKLKKYFLFVVFAGALAALFVLLGGSLVVSSSGVANIATKRLAMKSKAPSALRLIGCLECCTGARCSTFTGGPLTERVTWGDTS